jgi:WD40 repeat protein
LKVLPSGNHILGASKNGQVILIYIQQWDPLAIKIEQLASINTNIHSFDVSFLEPYNKWLVGTSNGKVIVYNRKDFNAYQQELFNEENPPRYNFMDSFNTLDYVDNSFTESKRTNTLDHYYSVSKRNLVLNEVDEANRCTGIFSNADLTLHISFIAKASYLFIRNFELHQVVKRIALQSLPLQLGITPNSSFFFVLQQDNVLKMIDFVNTENTSEILTIHSEAQVIKICPNGRYVLTGGSNGDICIWQVKRREIIKE